MNKNSVCNLLEIVERDTFGLVSDCKDKYFSTNRQKIDVKRFNFAVNFVQSLTFFMYIYRMCVYIFIDFLFGSIFRSIKLNRN